LSGSGLREQRSDAVAPGPPPGNATERSDASRAPAAQVTIGSINVSYPPVHAPRPLPRPAPRRAGGGDPNLLERVAIRP
jgi:hypothetical protein